MIAERQNLFEPEDFGKTVDESFANQRGADRAAAFTLERCHRFDGGGMATDAAESVEVGTKVKAGSIRRDMIPDGDTKCADRSVADANASRRDVGPLLNAEVVQNTDQDVTKAA